MQALSNFNRVRNPLGSCANAEAVSVSLGWDLRFKLPFDIDSADLQTIL